MTGAVAEVSPGVDELIDLHCHGAVGVEFGADTDANRRAAAHHRGQGSRLVASLVSAPAEVLVAQVSGLAPLVMDGTLLGIHLEGPFLSPARRGAHDPKALRDPDPELVERLTHAAESAGAPGAIRHWTFAPERDGADRFIAALARHHIRPAIGHTDADATTVSAAVDAITEATGAPALFTHLFNGMPPMHHRAGGPVAAALAAAGRGAAIVEVIADGTHVAAEVVAMVFETLGAERIALVSDAMAATGLGDGEYRLGGLEVDVAQGVARLRSTGSIAGSTATLADCVRWCVEVAGIDPQEARRAARETPRAVLNGTGVTGDTDGKMPPGRGSC